LDSPSNLHSKYSTCVCMRQGMNGGEW
jgi:hypothetical protein